MALTQKRKDELYDELVRRSAQRVRDLLAPKSIAERMYPKLKTNADDQPKQGPIQGWAHLKEKRSTTER